ncbi:MAG TPA: YdcF family protein [Polyangiales bacterium]|nr:YdcF family protein [Polyangiales bacterium]
MRLACVLSLLSACAAVPAPTARLEADAILVLGHRPPLRDRAIESELRARVDHGVALYRAGRAPWLVMSGGESPGGAVEADVMAAHAEQAGVPGAAILRERASRDTIENARLSIALLRARLQRAPRVLLVTSDYHIDRAARLVACAGAEVEASPADPGLDADESARRARNERWIRVYYGFIAECRRAR